MPKREDGTELVFHQQGETSASLASPFCLLKSPSLLLSTDGLNQPDLYILALDCLSTLSMLWEEIHLYLAVNMEHPISRFSMEGKLP